MKFNYHPTHERYKEIGNFIKAPLSLELNAGGPGVFGALICIGFTIPAGFILAVLATTAIPFNEYAKHAENKKIKNLNQNKVDSRSNTHFSLFRNKMRNFKLNEKTNALHSSEAYHP